MRKFLFISVLFAVAVMMTGCSLYPKPIQPTTVPTPPANVTCNELSFYLDPALGSKVMCESVPENSSSDIPVNYPFIYPSHTMVTIQDYPLSRTQFPLSIRVYPLNRYSELLPDYIPPRILELKSIISNGTWDMNVIPFLPPNPQVQTFHIHESLLSFNGGKGIRFITDYSDAPFPTSNKSLIYTYQGLTDDGKYWLAITMPIGSPILPDERDTYPEGYTFESLLQDYDAYVADVVNALELQAPDSFFPPIDSLDNLVKSIIIRD